MNEGSTNQSASSPRANIPSSQAATIKSVEIQGAISAYVVTGVRRTTLYASCTPMLTLEGRSSFNSIHLAYLKTGLGVGS